MNKGYNFELKTKHKYQKKGLILRLAKWQLADFIFIDFKDQIIYLIECKKRKGKHWYPSQHDVQQFKRLLQCYNQLNDKYLNSNEGFNFKIIYEIREGKEEKVLTLEEVEKEYFKNDKNLKL